MWAKALLLACTALLASICGCYRLVTGDCEETVRFESWSPGEAAIATIAERNCGATTSFSTVVRLRHAQDKHTTYIDSAVLVLSGKSFVTLSWAGQSQLVVEYESPEVFKRLSVWRDIQILYRVPRALP